MPVRGVDDEHVGAGVEQVLGLGRHVAVDADGRGDPQPAPVVDGGGVQVRPQRARAGEDADQPAVVGHDRGQAAPGVRQGVERRLDVDPVLQGHHVADHDVVDLGEPVDAGEVGLRDDADRPVADGDDGGAVRPLVQQHQGLADGHRGGQRDRGVVDEVARLLPGDHLTHDVGRDVLRDDGQRTPAGRRLGHPPSGDRRHVGHDERDRRPGAVDAREVDVQPAGHRRPVGHHEDVVVGQVDLRLEVVEETHPTSVGAATADGAGPSSGSGSSRFMGQDRVVSLMAPSPADAARRAGLRRMRALALSLLLLAAVIYALTLNLDQSGVWGYVNTAAEAAMVGALADWFAVTALFRHPLGLPVPHTAIIPKRKNEIGRSLQEFVTENFLTEEIARDRLAAARVGQRVGLWLGVAEHRRRVRGEVVRVATAGLGRLSDDEVRALVEDFLVPRLVRSRSLRSPAPCSRGSSTSRRTTAWSTSGSSSCATGSPTTRARTPPCSASGRRGGRRRGSTTG